MKLKLLSLITCLVLPAFLNCFTKDSSQDFYSCFSRDSYRCAGYVSAVCGENLRRQGPTKRVLLVGDSTGAVVSATLECLNKGDFLDVV